MTTASPRMTVWVALVSVALVITGCATSSDPVPETQIVQGEPENLQEMVPEAPPPGGVVCDEASLATIQETILAQSTALAAKDFEAAYAFASPAFKAGVTLEMFERVITQQYDMLTSFEDAVFGSCEIIQGQTAQLNVEVRSTLYRPVAMVYDMVFVDGQWWVSAVDNPVSAVPNT